MICIFCGTETKVNNSRSKTKSASTWRRRQCLSCKTIFSTTERPDLSNSIKIKDGSGRYKAFSEDKLFISVYECLSHRKDSHAASRSLINTILEKILPAKGNNLSSATLAREAYGVLRRYDKPAALMYKARHPIF